MNSPQENVMDSRFVDEASAIGNQRFRHDDKLYASFSVKPVFDQFTSNEKGRPVYVDREFITIIVPGDKHSVVMRQSRDADKQRFPRQYEAFKQGREEQQQGTPLSLIPWITPARLEEYRFFKIQTVEQLAGAADEVGKNFMGFQQDKQKAQQYLDASLRGVTANEMEEKLAERDQELEDLKAQVAALTAAKEQEAYDSVSVTGSGRDVTEEPEDAVSDTEN